MTENGNLYAVLVCDEYCDGDNVVWLTKCYNLTANAAVKKARYYKKVFGYRRSKIKRMEVEE